MEEILEIWDWDTGEPTGKGIPRSESHKKGIPHEAVHLWILKDDKNLLFQHRAPDKDSYPDCLDITIGGHVPFQTSEDKLAKEAYEEVGIIPDKKNLIDLGYFRYEERNNNRFHREFQHLFILKDNRPLNSYQFTDGEVVGIFSVPFSQFKMLFSEDFSFEIEGYTGNTDVLRKVSRKDFHPELFASSMNRYIEKLFDFCLKQQ